MRALLLVVLLAAASSFVAAPVASACPEEPCDPPPMPLCPPITDLDPSRPVGWLKDWVECVR